ncbi:DUF2325 domain-containing protein [Halonatronum saccharophilum]|uniref:DUF2325 domain-containing protein n=1 Tax=Halonatronum saccharophilum TaxID=150060 RepID=UPI002480DD50|nr:DUF2325 domain-containing protein [Halonatronum saccharophilum]
MERVVKISILVVGGDSLGNIPSKLKSLGFDEVLHITGRKSKRCKIAKNIDMVLVLTDYVSHNLCEDVKLKAKSEGVKCLFCRRSWACIYKKMSMWC